MWSRIEHSHENKKRHGDGEGHLTRIVIVAGETHNIMGCALGVYIEVYITKHTLEGKSEGGWVGGRYVVCDERILVGEDHLECEFEYIYFCRSDYTEFLDTERS